LSTSRCPSVSMVRHRGARTRDVGRPYRDRKVQTSMDSAIERYKNRVHT
jgi:hypothetical protein